MVSGLVQARSADKEHILSSLDGVADYEPGRPVRPHLLPSPRCTTRRTDSVPQSRRRTSISQLLRIKVRQQLQLKSLSHATGQASTRSTNAFRTLVDMIRSEGVLSIYKGLSGSMLREAIYSFVPFLLENNLQGDRG